MTLTVGSLFSGIGGLDLGLERAGMRVIWQSEIDPYATRVLAKHWPEVPNLGDIKRINWRDVVRPDVICGGYPCQPFSTAGQRKGEEDPRHLWPWVREAIRILRPRYAILENVRGHLSLGGTTVLSEIAALGYSAEWRIVSAASVGANHRRDRIVIVAYPSDMLGNGGHNHPRIGVEPETVPELGDGSRAATLAYPNGSSSTDGGECSALSGEDRSGRDDRGGSDRDPREVTVRSAGEDPRYVADGTFIGGDGREPQQCGGQNGSGRTVQVEVRAGGCDLADTASRFNVRGDGQRPNYRGEVYGGDNLRRGAPIHAVGEWWQTEPDVGRVANGIPSRVDRLRGLGNAVVPQVAEVIGRLVVAHNEQQPH